MAGGPATRSRVKASAAELQDSLKTASEVFNAKFDKDDCLEATDRNFEILGVVGEGSYGRIYKAKHAEYGVVALKVQNLSDERVASRERKFLSAIKNRYILKCIAYYKDERRVYLVTEYAPYGPYSRVMHCKDEGQVKPFYAQLVCALEYLHAVGITHGDAHPGNMLIFRGGHMKLGDFGLAERGRSGLSTFMGDVKYIPPEMILDRPHGSAVDWWYFGVIMYEQLVGEHPYYREDEDSAIMDRELREIMKRPLEALQRELPVSRDAEDLIRKTMEMDPDKRAGRDDASIRAIRGHPWFNGVVYGLFLEEGSVLPEFEKLKLKEVEVIPVD